MARQLKALAQRAPASVSITASEDVRRKFAGGLASAARQDAEAPSFPSSNETPVSIFVVHGHDEEFLAEVTGELRRLGILPIVLKYVRTRDDHLFAKFKSIAGSARHAIVLVSGDDVGAAFKEFDHPAGGTSRLEFRARQNVILELGYFYGKLGEERVFVFRKPPPNTLKIVGRFEEPSDLAGKIFEDFSGDWKAVLLDKLRNADFAV
ncbi:MAG: nucleotide-binding protein [Candidatus Competibacteraceae bacterium]|nr:nucleotide-binding protein [Candidatus Competibacteraceae bacterium]